MLSPLLIQRLAATLAGAAACGLAVAACGSSQPAAHTTTLGAASLPGASTFSTPHYSISVPHGLQHFRTTGSTGRLVNAWVKAGVAQIEATYDPHPATLAGAVAAARTGARTDHLTNFNVSDVTLAGARSAKLITDAGQAPKFFASDAELIALTKRGAMIEVTVATDGNPSARSVINSISLPASP